MRRSRVKAALLWKRLPHSRWTLKKYHHAIDAGVFNDDPRLQLIKGTLYRTRPATPSHATITRLFQLELERTFAAKVAFVGGRYPVTIPPNSEPEPDIAVVRGVIHDYSQHHPGPGDILLAVEVSDATLTTDRSIKAPLYAEAGIAEYWILDLNARALEVYRNPVNGVYSVPTRHDETASVLPLAAPPDAAPVAVTDLLP